MTENRPLCNAVTGLLRKWMFADAHIHLTRTGTGRSEGTPEQRAVVATLAAVFHNIPITSPGYSELPRGVRTQLHDQMDKLLWQGETAPTHEEKETPSPLQEALADTVADGYRFLQVALRNVEATLQRVHRRIDHMAREGEEVSS